MTWRNWQVWNHPCWKTHCVCCVHSPQGNISLLGYQKYYYRGREITIQRYDVNQWRLLV